MCMYFHMTAVAKLAGSTGRAIAMALSQCSLNPG